MSSPEDLCIVFVLGGPGSGKGTQCGRISRTSGWAHFSAGDLLRAAATSMTEQGKELQAILDNGGMVPFSITLGLLKNAIAGCGMKNVMLDGFPRALDQAQAFEQVVCPCAAVLYLDCPEEEMEKRLLSRQDGRSDDVPDAIRKRFNLFREMTAPVIDHYRKNGKLTTVKADRDQESVFADIKVLFDELDARRAARTAISSAEDSVVASTNPPTPPPVTTAPPTIPEDFPNPSLMDLVPTSFSALNVSEPTNVSATEPGPIVIIGPSGVGKGTLIERLMEKHASKFGFCVSHTTRGPRPGEENGVHYHFSNVKDVQASVDAGDFVEYAHVHGNIYGTSSAAVKSVADAGKVAILDIDVQGALLVKKSTYGPSALFLFIAPPSMSELESRLRGRGTETEEKIVKRLGNAKAEIEKSKEAGFADHVIVNSLLDVAYSELVHIIAKHAPGRISSADLNEAGSLATAAVMARALDVEAQAATEVATHLLAATSDADKCLHNESEASNLPRLQAREYMDSTVVPVLREALRALNRDRPEDPLQHVIDFLCASKTARGALHA